MHENKINHWHAKLAAWTHDPAEKALVLMSDPSGHEGGTIVTVGKACGFRTKMVRRPDGREIEKLDLEELEEIVKRADHWAAAADRPQWPRDPNDGRYAAWAQVRFLDRAVLIHPLSGEPYEIGKLDIDAQQVKAVSTDHFSKLIVRDQAGEADPKRTALAFWRFGPKAPAKNLGALWGLLPADTRVPDHTIWAHLDLASAFATAFHADLGHNPALLTVSFGPVQDFIAKSRTTSDLWAGSHLLSRIAWEGLKVVCADLGPDCVLFPQLRGVPQVDLWLRDEINLPAEWFADEEWTKGGTDANPLFAAALPNKFVAIVPASRARELARAIEDRVRNWTLELTNTALDALLPGMPDAPAARQQIGAQLEGFPEVHWTAVPWAPLVAETQKGVSDVSELAAALAPFYPAGNDMCGFLGSDAWKLLSKESVVDGATFFTPNPGVLYPALYDLLDRAQAAGKSARPFTQLPHRWATAVRSAASANGLPTTVISWRCRQASARDRAASGTACRVQASRARASTCARHAPSSACGRTCSRRRWPAQPVRSPAASSSPRTRWRWRPLWSCGWTTRTASLYPNPSLASSKP